MMCLSTTQIVVDTVNIFRAFIDLERQQRIMFLLDVTQPIFAAKHAIYFTMMLIGDIIVIYRAFVVWGGNIWVILFPSLCSLGSAISAYQTIWAVRHIASASIKAETGWGLAVFSLSLAANSIATGLIAFKIWKSEHQLKNAMGASNHASRSRSSLMPVVILVVESGVLNAAYLLAYTIVLRSGSEGLEIMASIATPYIGIIFSAVIIRAGLAAQGSKAQSTPWKPSPMPSNSVSRGTINVSSQWSTVRDDGQEVFPLKKMNV